MATAIPVIGGREVVVTSGATESAYRNALGYSMLDANGVPGPDTLVFAADDAVAPGTRFDLGAFPTGSLLEFFILQDGGARLAGGEHVRMKAATAAWGGLAVAFEDLLADAALNPGGLARDGDFNDVAFTLSFGASAAAGAVRVVFGADDGVHGTELWITDGTAEGTRLVLDINPAPVGGSPRDVALLGGGSSSPNSFAALGGGRALFAANDGVHGPEPWVTDGTTEGTRLLRDIDPGAGRLGGSLIADYTALGDGRAVFGAFNGANGTEPWITDGTPEGTRLVLDVNPGTGDSFPGHFAALGGGRAVFGAMDPVNGQEPWVTDGTAEGTRLLRDVQPGPGGGSSVSFAALGGGRALFLANDGVTGFEPWVTDGTAEGTRLLRDIHPGPGSGSRGDFAAFGGGRALFAASDRVTGFEPWVTDGTPEGTRLVRDIRPGTGDSNAGDFTALGDGRALFAADDGATGFELWITDGTAEGTRPVRDIVPGTFGSFPGGFTALGDGRALFFPASAFMPEGPEPWVTDGSAEGTRLLRDIRPGPVGPPSARNFTALGDGRALFTGDDGVSGPELWITDGTPEGTRLVRDIDPGPGGSLFSGPLSAFALLETGAQSGDHHFV